MPLREKCVYRNSPVEVVSELGNAISTSISCFFCLIPWKKGCKYLIVVIFESFSSYIFYVIFRTLTNINTGEVNSGEETNNEVLESVDNTFGTSDIATPTLASQNLPPIRRTESKHF